ncbi:MAG: MlaE family ABC transporter permease, partial [Thermodesulfobacteriota bacterium]
GQATLSMKRLVTGRARFRASDFLVLLQDCGPSALPIITLISVLVGLILAFVGAIQLEMFGAEIFVANLVGLGMAREMGAMMAAIIMAGRTGAAFAAQIGTMQVNEEVDALRTLGLSAVDFLVLPRLLAMGLLMPLLAIYADVMGILGGAIVGVGMLDISPAAYFQQTQESVPLHHFATGLIKSVFFGAIVALSGCMRGMRCGRSAMAVGGAATSAVVTAIVWIIVTDAAFTVLFNVVGL